MMYPTAAWNSGWRYVCGVQIYMVPNTKCILRCTDCLLLLLLLLGVSFNTLGKICGTLGRAAVVAHELTVPKGNATYRWQECWSGHRLPLYLDELAVQATCGCLPRGMRAQNWSSCEGAFQRGYSGVNTWGLGFSLIVSWGGGHFMCGYLLGGL